MARGNFGTAINCMDGRVQIPVIEWMKETFGVDYVDMVTEAGPDKVVASGSPEQLASILEKVKVSVEEHGSKYIAIAAHDDCAGNPVSKEKHVENILVAMQVIRDWNLPASIYGLWIDAKYKVELVDKIIKMG